MSEYHAEASPSGAAGWLSCPSWQNDKEGSVYADEGTAAHTLFAWCLTEKRDALAYKGRRIAVGTRTFEVDNDMATHVQVAVDLVRHLVAVTGGVLFVEQDLPIDHITGEVGATGRGDACIVCPDEIIVIDLKYGYRVVSAIDNPQCKMYISGAAEKYAMLGDFKTGRVLITQPRVSPTPSEWSISIAELTEWQPVAHQAAQLMFATRKGLEVEKFTPSEKGCEWCARKATCTGLADWVQKTVGADFDVLPQVFGPGGVDIPDMLEGEDSDRIALKADAAGLIEQWIKAVRGEVEKRLIAGGKVCGWKLVQGKKGPRKWSDASVVEDYMKHTMRLKVEEMYDLSLVSPTTAEKLVTAKVIGPKQWKKLQESITQSSGSMSVAPDTDSRKALEVKPVSDDFDVQVEGPLI